ncbi:unnamed protein product, partial [Mesorhabditis belari]|uniref:Uncharacterized protein n=1 Tax=Mesorhabditis belari TaxID=2138241 RepID=A0AAF3FB89_9BILA
MPKTIASVFIPYLARASARFSSSFRTHPFHCWFVDQKCVKRWGAADCTSCEEDLSSFVVNVATFPDKLPSEKSAPVIFNYKTRPDGCMIASSVCNPDASPKLATLFAIAKSVLTAVSDLNTAVFFGGQTQGPARTTKTEFRCEKGVWYSVVKANPKKRLPVGSIICVTEVNSSGK